MKRKLLTTRVLVIQTDVCVNPGEQDQDGPPQFPQDIPGVSHQVWGGVGGGGGGVHSLIWIGLTESRIEALYMEVVFPACLE